MLDIEVIKSKEMLTIEWQYARINLPLEEIVEIINECINVGEKANVVRIGMQYASSNCILIKTKKLDYALFTTNKNFILNEINSYSDALLEEDV